MATRGTTKGKLTSQKIKRGPRKGQTVTGYLYPNGKFKELKGSARGSNAQRRQLARKAGLRDRFGRTAEERAAVRHSKGVYLTGPNHAAVKKPLTRPALKLNSLQSKIMPKRASSSAPKASTHHKRVVHRVSGGRVGGRRGKR